MKRVRERRQREKIYKNFVQRIGLEDMWKGRGRELERKE